MTSLLAAKPPTNGGNGHAEPNQCNRCGDLMNLLETIPSPVEGLTIEM